MVEENDKLEEPLIINGETYDFLYSLKGCLGTGDDGEAYLLFDFNQIATAILKEMQEMRKNIMPDSHALETTREKI